MDANAGNDHDAEMTSGWDGLSPGQEVEVQEPGQPAARGVIDSTTADGSVVWVWVDGQRPRRMFLAGDGRPPPGLSTGGEHANSRRNR